MKAVLSLSPSSSQDLAASSLKASNYFDEKIEHLENYSNIIENATLKMDACVKDMTTVYQNYEKLYNESPASYLLNDESNSTNLNSTNLNSSHVEMDTAVEVSDKLEDASVYDMEKGELTELQATEPVNRTETGSIKSNMTDGVFNDQKSLMSDLSTEKGEEDNSFMNESSSTELKLEIK